MTSSPLAIQGIIDVLKGKADLLYSQNESLRKSAELHITLMSAALGLGGAFKAFDRPHDWVDIVLIVIILTLYGIGLLICLRVLSQTNWNHLFDLNDFRTRGDFDDSEYFDLVLNSYDLVIKWNRGIVQEKANAVIWTTILTAVLYFLVFILVAR